MNEWQSDLEDPPIGNPQSDSEDDDVGYHSDDMLKEMEGDKLNLSLEFQIQREINFLKESEVDPPTAFSELMKY